MIEEVRRRQVCLTFCTTCNPSSPEPRRAAELKRALELGLNVTVNTDDPVYMRSYYLSEVLLNTQQAVGLSREQVAELARNAFRSAWIGEGEREGYCGGGGWVCGWAIDCESAMLRSLPSDKPESLNIVCSPSGAAENRA